MPFFEGKSKWNTILELLKNSIVFFSLDVKIQTRLLVAEILKKSLV